jgi:CRP-like cAMP-binding protein
MLGKQGAVKERLSSLAPLSARDTDLLARLCSRQRTVKRHADLSTDGQADPGVYFLHEGWAARYKLFPDGRRQILMFVVPGDVVGLHQLLNDAAGESLATMTEMRLSQAPRDAVVDTMRQRHGLAVALWRSLEQEQAILAEHLASLGRRGALQRIGHLLLELRQRLVVTGEGSPAAFDCPLTQYELADALGLTAIHVNRVIRQLREQGLATIDHRRVTIHDVDALAAVAEFDGRFLASSPDGVPEWLRRRSTRG